MAAGQYARGSLGYHVQPNYEILEEIYDDSYEPTQEDVLEQCYQMGIDPVHEKDLVYIAMEALKAPLPESWRPISDGKGGYFYHNFATGQSTWEHPCDQFYLKMLDKEREKQASLAAANQRPSTSHGRQASGTAVAKAPSLSLKNAPALAPVKAPELPGSLSVGSSLKKPALAPIGATPKVGGGRGGGLLGDLPSLSLPLGPLNPLPTLEPLKPSLPPPLAPTTAVGVASGDKAPPTKEDTKKKDGGAGRPGSNLKHFPLRGSDLNVDHISTEFKDEEEEEEEDSLDKVRDFEVKKHWGSEQSNDIERSKLVCQ